MSQKEAKVKDKLEAMATVAKENFDEFDKMVRDFASKEDIHTSMTLQHDSRAILIDSIMR